MMVRVWGGGWERGGGHIRGKEEKYDNTNKK